MSLASCIKDINGKGKPAISKADQDLLKTFLQSCDCWDALQFVDGEENQVVPLVMG